MTDQKQRTRAEEFTPETNPTVSRGRRPTTPLLLFGAFSLLAATGASLVSPLGTAVYGPPAFPWALTAFVLLAIAATALAAIRRREFASRPERWVIPMALTIAVALLASPFPDRAAFPALVLLLLPASVIVFAALIDAGPDKTRRCLHLFRATAAVAVAVSLWGLVSWAVFDFGTEVGFVDQLANISGIELQYPGLWSIENPHPFGHKNFAAGFAILALPLLLAVSCLDSSRLRLFWLAGLPIVLIYLASAESRAGWLALAGGAAFYLLLRVLRQRTMKLHWWHLAVLAVILSIPFLASPRLRESAQRMGQEGSIAALDPYRWEMAQTGLATGNARPLTGFGPGALSLVSPAYGDSEKYPVVYQVHNTPIQLYAETGLAGLLGCLALIGGLALAWKRTGGRHRSSAEDDSGPIRDAATVAIVSYAFFAVTDYQLDVPILVLLAGVPVGALFGLAGNAPLPARRAPWLGAALVTALLLLPVLWFNTKGLFARAKLQAATSSLRSDNIDAFAAGTQRAHEWAPTDPFYLNQLANLWLTQWMGEEDPAERKRFAEEAHRALARSLEIAPAQDSVHFNLGILLRFQEKPDEAKDAFRNALRYNPRKRFANFLIGQVLLELGETEAAVEAFAKELIVNPDSLFLPLWQSPEVRGHLEERNERFFQLSEGETSSTIHRTRYFLSWLAGDPQPFQGNLSAQAGGFRVLATALEGDPEMAVTLAPKTPEAFLVRAWLHPEEAERWLRAGFFQAGGLAFSPSNLHLIHERLQEGDSFASAFRALLEKPGLPAEAKRGLPRAPGLFEHNLYGPPLFDFHVYYQPIVLLLF